MDVEEDETRRTPPTPYLPHELIVSEILVRLPVKSLLRFRCVCKAWRDTVSGDTSFSEAHARRRQDTKPSSLLIAPYIRNQRDRDLFVMERFVVPGLYLWEEQQQRQEESAILVHDMASFPMEYMTHTRHGLAHCDGLVMLPTADGTVRLLNPATRRRLTLPWSPNSAAVPCGRSGCRGVDNTFGFGRDPRSGAYKVARFFHHVTYDALPTCSTGMEVFAVGKDSRWRRTVAEPPYPFLAGRTATFFKGSLIWTVDHDTHLDVMDQGIHFNAMDLGMHFDVPADVPCFVRFSLEDESFSVIPKPRYYSWADYIEARLSDLHGELAMARLNRESVEIWICIDVDGVKPRWVRRHVLDFVSLVAAFDDGTIVFQDMLYYLMCQSIKSSQGSKDMVGMTDLKYRNPNNDTLAEYSRLTFDVFDVIPYIPTLVPI